MKVWKGRDGNKPLKVRTLAAQSQTERGQHHEQLASDDLGFCTSLFLSGFGRRGTVFQVGHLEAPRRPHLDAMQATQVHWQEGVCSCRAHIKDVWSSVGVQGDQRYSWCRH